MPTENTVTSTTKIAIVTGGSRGIGRNTVLSLAKRGVDTIFTYNANQAEAEKVAGMVAEAGRKAVALQLDIGSVAAFGPFVQSVRHGLTELGAERFDYLVNNAGNSSNSSFAEVTEAEFDELIDIHFKGVFFLTQRLADRIADNGSIVNISSGLARFAMPKRIAYGSVKGAVEVMTRYMAMELGPRGITANVVAPGAVATDFSGGIVRDTPAYQEKIAEHTALGRHAVADDIGPVIASVLGDDHHWVTGQRIEASGGMHV